MPRNLSVVVCLMIVIGGLSGCTSTGLFRSRPFGHEQWEPDVEEETKSSDWRSEPSQLRKSKGMDKAPKENALDKLIWSDTARDINRNLGGDY
jgi:hypothetical protein